LSIEQLEDRTVPSTFTWVRPEGNPADWTLAGNWQKVGNDAGSYPGQTFNGDIAILNNTSVRDVTLNRAMGVDTTIAKLEVTAAYSGTITISTALIVTAAQQQNVALAMAGGTIATGLGQKLTVTSGKFDWTGGTIASAGSATVQLQKSVTLTIGGNVTLDRALILNQGQTSYWTSGNITLNNGSRIQIGPATTTPANRYDATFNVSSSGTISTAAGATGSIVLEGVPAVEQTDATARLVVDRANPNAPAPAPTFNVS
jgi:hypothetical protein